jgi:hypothetical protein
MTNERRDLLADLAGLAALMLALADYLRPSLLLLPTTPAGGDTPSHYPTAVFFDQLLLPALRVHGWFPGAYLGHPLLLYYFPLPFVLTSALAHLFALPAAFKLATAGGVFLLPILAYASLRLSGLRFPAPLIGAASCFVFLLVEENPIWGGTLASTLTGEFSYTYGLGLGLLFLGLVWRAAERGSGPWAAGAVLGLTALAHGYAVVWAGVSSAFLLYTSRRALARLLWLASVAAIAFALAAFWLVPLLVDWRFTTPYNDPWITIAWRSLFPPALWPFLALAALAVVWLALGPRWGEARDLRLLHLLHSALVGAALAAVAPVLGVIDVRLVPFAQLALTLAGGAMLGIAIERLAARRVAALGVVLLAIVFGDGQTRVLRQWIEWNESGLEAKELWPAFSRMCETIRGSVSDPRVAVEYGQVHERAGSIRMYETLPLFSGRSTLEGVYNQASLQTHPVYYLASELGASSPNPFRSREYSTFDTASALDHLRLFAVGDIVAVSDTLAAALDLRLDVERVAHVAPYHVFRLKQVPRYVEPLAFAPVRSSPSGWADKAYRWFTRKPPSRAHLVFTHDARFGVVERDEWLAPPEVPLDAGAITTTERIEAERVTITTDRIGHPLLVKISYHPRWRATGADGPYLVSPALMLVVPRKETITLEYSRSWADDVGLALSCATALLALVWWRKRADGPAAEEPSLRRVGWAATLAALALAGIARLAWERRHDPSEARSLYERASQSYAAERFSDAAEYARHALGRAARETLRTEILCLRAESLLRSGRPQEAAKAFERAIAEAPDDPHVPQALYGAARAHAAAGETAAAQSARDRLLSEHPGTPWADEADDSSAGSRGPDGRPRP